jgi:hypothetical protein
MCANKKCSKLTCINRKTINQYNIYRILGLSGEKECCHISKNRQENADPDDKYSSSESDSEPILKNLPQRDSKVAANKTIGFINNIIHDYSEFVSDESSQAEKSDDDSSSSEEDSTEETSSSDSSFKEESSEEDKSSAKSKIVFGARPNTTSKTIFGARPNYASKVTPVSSSCTQQ